MGFGHCSNRTMELFVLKFGYFMVFYRMILGVFLFFWGGVDMFLWSGTDFQLKKLVHQKRRSPGLMRPAHVASSSFSRSACSRCLDG